MAKKYGNVDANSTTLFLWKNRIMRLHFTLSPNTETVPFGYQRLLTGTFHKLLGENAVHDAISLYSLSWLHGGVTMRNGKKIEGGLDFPQGA
jgi:hypothetical protein